MAFLRRFRPATLILSAFLALALWGVVVQECAAQRMACKADCCLPTPACLSLNFGQIAAPTPAAPPTAPAVTLALLAVLFVAAFPSFVPRLSVSLIPFRSDPGGRRVLSRAQLHCWVV